MEGFTEDKVRQIMKIPKRLLFLHFAVISRYQIASIVSFGYKARNAVVYDTPRFPTGFGLLLV